MVREERVGDMGKQGIRVLLVDDHNTVRTSLHRMLEHTGDIEVVGEGINGLDALKMVENLNPDVLILDVEMPEMDGIEVTHILNKMNSPVKILILSAYDDEGYIKNVLEQGAVGYLIKDEPPANIIEAVRLAVRGKKAEKSESYNQDYRLNFHRASGHLG